jgi:hypothetical protein
MMKPNNSAEALCLRNFLGFNSVIALHQSLRIDDSRLAALFARDVLSMLVGRELLSSEWAERILSWRHTGFSVHSLVRAKTKVEAERVGKYMLRPLLSLERLSFNEKEGRVIYRYGKGAQEQERMDYLEFIARVTCHIPDKGQVTVRYYGLYANAHRGKIKKANLAAFPLRKYFSCFSFSWLGWRGLSDSRQFCPADGFNDPSTPSLAA